MYKTLKFEKHIKLFAKIEKFISDANFGFVLFRYFQYHF